MYDSALNQPDVVWIYSTLPIVLYGYEIWCLTLKQSEGWASFDNRMLREVFGTEREAVTWGGRKVHEEIAWFVPNKVYLVDQIEDEEIGGTCDNEGGGREMHETLCWGKWKKMSTLKT